MTNRIFNRQPLTQLPLTESVVPYITDLTSGPPRCRRCRAYVNCHVQFVDGGRHWNCNLCGMTNAVEGEYFSTLDHTGQRRDIRDRRELRYGSVDFAASSEYYNRPAMHPAYMFAIDTSSKAAQSGLLQASVDAVLSALEGLDDMAQRNNLLQVGLLTFDTHLQFYNLHKECEEDELPGVYVVPDIDDPFVPTPHCMAPLLLHRATIEKVLRALPEMYADAHVGEAAVGAALQVSFSPCDAVCDAVLQCVSQCVCWRCL